MSIFNMEKIIIKLSLHIPENKGIRTFLVVLNLVYLKSEDGSELVMIPNQLNCIAHTKVHLEPFGP